MKTFIYKVTDSSTARGYNRTITVYSMKNNVPQYIGFNNEINTTAYKGDRPVDCQIISDTFGYKMKDGYRLLSKHIHLHEI